MVGTAIGAAQCFYWLHEDVLTVQAALSRKISSIAAQLDKKDQQTAMRLAAIHDAVPSRASPSLSPTAQQRHSPAPTPAS